MIGKIYTMVILPLLRRLGTLLSGFLIAQGYSADVVDPLIAAIVTVVALTVDLVMSARNKKKGD